MRVRYEGVVHETAVWESDCVVGRLEGDYYVESRRLGARSQDTQKCARDRDLLLAEVERNPEDARSVFYLAQSYFDLDDFVNARKWYERRVEMGGSDEEVYYSMVRVAESMAKLDWPWLVVQDAYLKAWEFRPTRAEALHAIARRYREEQRYLPGHLFAQRAARIPFPEKDLLFVGADVYAWRAVDEQAVCASQLGNHAEAFMLCRRLLALSDIPDGDRQRIAVNRDFSVPVMLEAASSYPDALVQRLAAGPGAKVVVSLVAGPDRETTEQAINSFLNCCLDLSLWFGRFLVVDAGLSAPDRALLRERYGFLEFVDCSPGDGPATQLAQLRAQIQGRFWLHLGQGWQFFAPESFITRLIAVLESEPQVFQVGINFADAVKADRRLRGRGGGAPRTLRRPLRRNRCGGQRPGDVRHRTPRSGRQHRGQRPRSHRRTRLAGGRCRTTDRQPRRGALHRRGPTRAATQSPGTGREEGRSPTRAATQSPGTGREEGRGPARAATRSPGAGREEGRGPARAATRSPGAVAKKAAVRPVQQPAAPARVAKKAAVQPVQQPAAPARAAKKAAVRPVQQPAAPARAAKKAAVRPVQQPAAPAPAAKKAAARPVQQPKAPAQVAQKGRRPKTPPQ